MKSVWILVWHLNDCHNNDVFLKGVFNTREEAQGYLDKISKRFGNTTVFSILEVPIG